MSRAQRDSSAPVHREGDERPAARDSVVLRIDGRDVDCPADITVAAALLNAGVSAFRTSVSGSVRGPVCGMGTCFECRVTVDGLHGRRACMLTVRDGMDVRTDAPSPV